MLEMIARRLRLDPDETRRALALFGLLFAVSASYTLVKTVRDALFLARLPVTVLPWVLVGVGLLTVLASVAFTMLTRRRTVLESLSGAALVIAVLLAVFAQLFRLKEPWVPIAFYLFSSVYGVILTSQFWVFANSVSHAREAKRIFGFVVAGGIIGGLVAGLAATPLANAWTLSTILLVAAVLQAIVGFMAWRTPHGEPEPEAAGSVEARESTNPMRRPYVRYLAIAALCSVVVSGVVEYQFKAELQRRFLHPAQLASFIGLFYTASSIGALVLQIVGTRWMIQRLGAGWSSAALPIGLALGSGASIVAPGFGAVTATRIWDQIGRQSINRAANELFYFPLPPAVRRRARALIETGVERVGDGAAGLLILLAGATAGLATRTTSILALIVLLIWVIAWFGVRSGYVRELGLNLRRLNIDHRQARISLREASLLREMQMLLDSPFERVVLQGIDMLAENAPEVLVERWPQLLEHASPAVRARGLQFVREHRFPDALPLVESMLQDENLEVRVQAVATRSVLVSEDPLTHLEEFMGSPDPHLRAAVIQSLAEFSTDEPRARAIFAERLANGPREDRVAIAEALARRGGVSVMHELLTALVRDPDLQVRRAALRSAGIVQRRPLVPVLLEALGARETEREARAGLAAFGDRVVGTLGDYLTDATVQTEVRIAIPRVLGDIHSQESINALFRYRERELPRLAYRVLKATNKIRVAQPMLAFPRSLVVEDLEHDVRTYLFSFVNYRVCPIGTARGPERLLCIALNERMEQSLDRIFRRLALVFPPEEVFAAYRGIISDSPRLRGNALEYLENALDADLRGRVLPLVDDSGDAGRLRAAETRYGLRVTSYEQTLEALLQGEDPWLKACALFVAGSRRQRDLLPLVESNLSTLDKLVRETASWAQLAIATG